MFSNKNIAILITLLFVTSQVFAYSSMVCDMESSNTEISMSEMDHSNHNMDMMDSDTKSENMNMMDCCDMSCKCSIGSCSTTFLLGLTSSHSKFLNAPNHITPEDQRISSIEISSLQRPPITC
jgi:hypothetical protein